MGTETPIFEPRTPEPYKANRMKHILVCVLVPCTCSMQATADENEAGNMSIRAEAGQSEIVITTTARLAGAIHSLRWRGKEFINSSDHGRQLQSAANFDVSSRFTAETFNPTEAGSRNDGAGPKSTSRLLHRIVGKDSLQTTTQMAFWLQSGQTSGGHPAKNQTALSNHLLTKRVQIGYRGRPHIIQYDVTFSMPINERHKYAQFEAVTGYMPAEFSRFWKYNSSSRNLEPLNDGPGEQAWPVVLSTQDREFAMGVFSPDQPSPGYRKAGYGRFRFAAQKVTKWNCVFRIRDEQQVTPGDYSFRMFVLVGDLKMVTESMRLLHEEFADAGSNGNP